MNYLKAVAMVVATAASAIIAALSGDQSLSAVEWVNVALAVVGAVSVGVVPELDAGIAKQAKLIVASATAVLTALVSSIVGGMTTAEWLQLLVVGLGAVGVGVARGPKHAKVAYDLAG